MNPWLFLAGVNGILAVAAGAYGWHWLETHESAQRDIFNLGVQYHMWHALAMFGTGVLMRNGRSRCLSAAAWCFAGGILLFSGALYVLAIGGPSLAGIRWGAVAPFGGTLLLFGWIFLAIGTARSEIQP